MLENTGAKLTGETKPIRLMARCGHEDLLGYFANTPCGKCVRKAHRKAVSK